MASLRVLAAGLSALGLALTLASCAPSPGSGPPGDEGYESTIAAVVLAESDAGGRAFALETEGGTSRIRVAVGDRDVEVEVEPAGPTVAGRHEGGDLDADDRAALSAASTPLADAIRIAAAAYDGNRSVDEVALDRDGGAAAWTIEFVDGGEVAVAATDGAIVRTED